MSRLVGMMGYAESGKDTAALALIDDGWQRRAFGDTLRTLLYELNPMLPDGQRLADLVDRVGWHAAKKNHLEVRELLQRAGDGSKSVYGPAILVETVLRDLGPGVVVTDVRFPEEADAIRAAGGLTVRVVRPGVGPINGHRSELALDGYQADVTLHNTGTVIELHAALLIAVSASGRR